MSKRLIAPLLCAFVLLTVSTGVNANAKKPSGEFYEIQVYHFTNRAQEDIIDKYLETAYLPALHKAGVKNVGVFKPISNDTAADKKLYVFTMIKSLNDILTRESGLLKDNTYMEASKPYADAAYDNVPYSRMERILIQAFPLAPEMNLPQLTSAKSEHVYELRSYEGPTEKLFRNKVQMFNQGGEIALFKRLGFNAVFYGSVISGSRMPNLMYMTSFENMQQREAHWDAFRNDAEWKTLSAKPEYQHNVAKAEVILMHATPYSDF